MKKIIIVIGLLCLHGATKPMQSNKSDRDDVLSRICKNDIRGILSPQDLMESRCSPSLKSGVSGKIQWGGGEMLPYSPEDRKNEFMLRIKYLSVQEGLDWASYYHFLLAQKEATVTVVDKYTLHIQVGKKQWKERLYRVLALRAMCYIRVF